MWYLRPRGEVIDASWYGWMLRGAAAAYAFIPAHAIDGFTCLIFSGFLAGGICCLSLTFEYYMGINIIMHWRVPCTP
jgi:hypothetical protein